MKKSQPLAAKPARSRWAAAVKITLHCALWAALLAVGTAQAQTLYDRDGIQLQGTARIVTYDAGTCRVLKETETEAAYEAKKANHGQPLHVWQLDFSAYNGTGKAPSFLAAHFKIESEWPVGALFQAGVLSKQFSGVAEALWNGTGRGGARHHLLDGVSRTGAGVQELVSQFHVGGPAARPALGSSLWNRHPRAKRGSPSRFNAELTCVGQP